MVFVLKKGGRAMEDGIHRIINIIEGERVVDINKVVMVGGKTMLLLPIRIF